MIKYGLPSDAEIKRIRALHKELTDPDGCVDDPEDLLNDLPDYLEMILGLHSELQATKRV